MTEWNGFKVGRLYISKYDDLDADGEPCEPSPMMVIFILPPPFSGADAQITFLHRGQVEIRGIPEVWKAGTLAVGQYRELS